MKNMLIGLGLLALTSSLALGYFAYRLYASEQVFQGWPTVPGSILSIAVQARTKAAVSGTATSATHRYWMVDVRYEYQVAGRRLVGERLSNAPPMENIDQHAEPSPALTAYLSRFPPGQIVTVHYAPAHPERSLLEVETGAFRTIGYAAAAALLLGVACLAASLLSGPPRR